MIFHFSFTLRITAPSLCAFSLLVSLHKQWDFILRTFFFCCCEHLFYINKWENKIVCIALNTFYGLNCFMFAFYSNAWNSTAASETKMTKNNHRSTATTEKVVKTYIHDTCLKNVWRIDLFFFSLPLALSCSPAPETNLNVRRLFWYSYDFVGLRSLCRRRRKKTRLTY